ncbi:unnamed protein product [Microthlaspi erraticum]|uniref:F-box domain-containing protein n=1 Tax=Microthlaspi erraticum TaxID=1685480 RepID=A0A6D2J793_9BRAS|nr:unnamed protein product [Microthlaspi erraticum]CAA7057899.1 unnamed protein product [Microthlaspi erraticum]
MTMLSNLPRDLEEELLSRVLITSLRLLRSTCKRWYHHALFKDPRFIKTHFDKTARQRLYQAFLLMDFRVYPVRYITNNVYPMLADKLSLIDPLSNSEVDITQAFYCDGILLCTTKDKRFVAWNPFSGQTRWIQPRNHHTRSEFYALGYDNKDLCRSYKILRVIDVSEQTMEIYELRSNSWRNLDVSPIGSFESLGVSLKGNTYWISKRGGVVKDYLLLKFDFSTEIFQNLCLPFHEAECLDTFALSVVREERLYLLYQCQKTRKMEIWVTSEIETTFASWSKYLAVDLRPRPHMLFSFFVEEEKKIVACCDQDEDRCRVEYFVEDGYKGYRRWCGDTECWPVVFGYVPRVVEISAM